MSNDLEDLLADLTERGLSEEDLHLLREATSATPLRQELKTVTARNRELEGRIMKSTFNEIGITMDPTALNIPSDLDSTDPVKVRAWAEAMNIIAPPVDPDAVEEIAALGRNSALAAGNAGAPNGQITPEDVAGWTMQQRITFSKNNPDKWETLKQGVSVPAS